MPALAHPFKYSGMIREDDLLHRAVPAQTVDRAKVAHAQKDVAFLLTFVDFILAPNYVDIPNGQKVPQWAPTVAGVVSGYNPARDCNGHFTSSKFQPNNNCYNYACNIATNSFAQPGRLHRPDLLHPGPTGPQVVQGAESDGLIYIGDSSSKASQLPGQEPLEKPGHFVALLISNPNDALGWEGDYHWVRSDERGCTSWSQKDGNDQVTNFDFAGEPISDPSQANWTVNQGPKSNTDHSEVVVTYKFFAWMFVPDGGVTII